MKRFVPSPEAAQDLNDIWEYIAADNLDAADRFLGNCMTRFLRWLKLQVCAIGETLWLYNATKGFVETVASAHGRPQIPPSLEEGLLVRNTPQTGILN